jgi:hypothetical protein
MSELAGAVFKKFPEPVLQDRFRRLAVSRQPSLTQCSLLLFLLSGEIFPFKNRGAKNPQLYPVQSAWWEKRVGDETGDAKRRGFGVVCGDEKPTVVRRPGMHKEMCNLLAGMKRSQRNHAVPGNTELAGHGSCSGSRGRPARRHARKLKRGGRGHCEAVRVQCTHASWQAGVSGRIARMLKQQARRRAGLRGKLRRRAEHYKGFNQLLLQPLGSACAWAQGVGRACARGQHT